MPGVLDSGAGVGDCGVGVGLARWLGAPGSDSQAMPLRSLSSL